MDSTQDRITLAMIKPVAIYSSLFGVVPWYNFNERNIVHFKIFKCYSMFLALAITALSLTLTCMRFKGVYKNHKIVIITEDIIMEMAGLCFFLFIVLGCRMHTWEALFERLQRTENRTILGREKINRILTPKRCIIIFALGNIYLITLFVLDFGHYDKGDNRPRYFISTLLFRYTQLIFMYIILYIVALMKHRYEELKWIFYGANRSLHFQANLLIRMEIVKELYVELYLTCKDFSKLFGWPILCLYFYCLMHMLNCLSFMTIRENNYDTKVDEYSWWLTLHMFYATGTAVWFTAIIILCDSIANEADELLAHCYILEQMLPLHSEETEQLNNMKMLIKDMKPRLSAAGFFAIRRSTLLSLLGAITTYFIVSLQFN